MKKEQQKGFTHDNVNNKSVDWYTPPWIFERLGLEFDLDPCSPVGGVPWIPAKKHYSLVDDGLTQDWENDLVWLNPPYGVATGAWLNKMHNHRKGIALVFSRTDCAWYHDFVSKADAILFLRGRVKFVDGLRLTSCSGAGCGSMLIAWGEESMLALEKMKDCGHLVFCR